jgi:NADH-quinone oxidoreductase subunit L
MGGLAPRMVITTITMTVGAAGLAGFPGLAGFFSKDEILAVAFHERRTAWALLLIGAFMTAFYTFRMLFLAFLGAPRMSKDVAHHIHESPPVMTVPLIVLAALTVVTGWILGVPSDEGTRFQRWLAPVFPLHGAEHGGVTGIMLLVLSVIVAFAGILLAWFMYGATPVRAEAIGRPRTVVHRLLLNAWYVDWLYDRIIVRPLFAASEVLARIFDVGVIDGAVNGLGRAVVAWAESLRRLQTGYVVNYALTMLAGAVAIVGFLLAR